MPSDSTIMKAFKQVAWSELQVRCGPRYTDPLTVAIHMLDPRNLPVLRSINPYYQQVPAIFEKFLMDEFTKREHDSSRSVCESLAPVPMSAHSDPILVGIEVDFEEKPMTPEDELRQAIIEYMKFRGPIWSCAEEHRNEGLRFWEEQSKMKGAFSPLISYARKILAIPASSSSVDRLWSSTLSEKRTNLDATLFEQMLMLQTNAETFIAAKDRLVTEFYQNAQPIDF